MDPLGMNAWALTNCCGLGFAPLQRAMPSEVEKRCRDRSIFRLLAAGMVLHESGFASNLKPSYFL